MPVDKDCENMADKKTLRHSANKKERLFRIAKAKSSKSSWEIYNTAAKLYKQAVATAKKNILQHWLT